MPHPPMTPPKIELTAQEAAYAENAKKFKQSFFAMKEHVLKYNLFVPEETTEPLPLVVFMHDMGSISAETDYTLRQGIGALVWADPSEQKKRPCFVLAPQYSEKSAHDDYTVGWAAEATIQLIQYICSKYNIDKTRIYGTGQSMGTMMLCELLITHPRFFAGCFLTAGQWDPERMAGIRDEHVWIMVSEHDGRAFRVFPQGKGAHRGHGHQKALVKGLAVFDALERLDQDIVAYDQVRDQEKAQPDQPVFDRDH